MKSVEKTVLTFALGIAIGAGIGVLFAPDKGACTRRKIKREYDSYINKIHDKIEDLKMKEKELVEKLRKATESKSHEA
ncbi:MAG: YtxH domain-containing protein [Prevotellaceae bacterium]|jgi:gas vesicle protein|nr:YtxH domain-containing protein [Prevotellaceae bacterium]